MKRLLAPLCLTLAALASTPILAAERTLTLAVPGMNCPVCPITVKKSLTEVAGVRRVVVSFEDKRAVITYDDAITNAAALQAATTSAGYPATVVVGE